MAKIQDKAGISAEISLDELMVVVDPYISVLQQLGYISDEKSERVPVEITGSRIPDPVYLFKDMELFGKLMDNIKVCKYVEPKPVQSYAIPVILGGRDLMACAPTGSGKKAAFCLPIISGVMQDTCFESYCSIAFPIALILSPTEDRSLQIFEEAKKLCFQTGVKIAHGTTLAYDLSTDKTDDVDILVSTPAKLLELFHAPELVDKPRLMFNKVKYLVIDDADEMLTKSHMEVRLIVNYSGMPKVEERQTIFFSDTLPSQIQKLAFDFLSSNYVFLSVGEAGSSEFGGRDFRSENNNLNDCSDDDTYDTTDYDGDTSNESSDCYIAMAYGLNADYCPPSSGYGNDIYGPISGGYGYSAPPLAVADFYGGSCTPISSGYWTAYNGMNPGGWVTSYGDANGAISGGAPPLAVARRGAV